jgi:hypothetical protein
MSVPVHRVKICTNKSLLTYLLTYLFTPWSRVLLEKLTGLQLVKKFPALYETQRFITVLTSARHLSLSWASSIQSITPNSTSWRSILILSSHKSLHLQIKDGTAIRFRAQRYSRLQTVHIVTEAQSNPLSSRILHMQKAAATPPDIKIKLR